MTAPGGAPPGGAVRLNIGQVTLHGYVPGRGDRFAAAIAARLSGAGAPAGAARRAAEAIIATVDARLGRPEREESHA